jgi:uncharacterized protein involved in exopolysaccharide biosynthesis
VNSDVGDRLATISQRIMSTTALKLIIDEFNLYPEDRKSLSYEEIIDEMRKDIEVKMEKGWSGNRPGAFRVGYRGPVPSVVAGVANRLSNLFVEENLRAREVQAEGTSEFIVNQLQEAKRKLDELEATLTKYKLEHNGELPQQENALIGTLGRMQLELQGNQEAINRAQQDKVLLENSLTLAEAADANFQNAVDAARAAYTARTGSATPDSPVGVPIRPLSSKALESELQTLRVRYGEDYPDVKRVRDELARVRVLEEKEKDKESEQQKQTVAANAAAHSAVPQKTATQPAAVATTNIVPLQQVQYRERMASLKAQLTLLDEELTHRAAAHERIQREIAAVETRVEKLPVREQEMASLMRDYEISRMNYKSLLDKKLAADMAADMERRQKAERFTIIDPARIPAKPFQPNRPLLYSVGAIAGLVLGIVFALARELRAGVLLGEWELPPDITLLGRIPRITLTAPDAPVGNTAGPGKRRRWQLGWTASAVLILLGALGAGLYAVTRLS